MKIAIVIGHTQKSVGAYNKDMGISEYELNVQEAEKVHNTLQADGIECVLIHRTTYKELPTIINQYVPNIVVSFHHNSYKADTTGTETLYYHKSTKGKELATVLQDKMVNTLGYKNRGIRPKGTEDRGGYLLKYTDAPCVILEPCFMSNTNELKDFISKQDDYCEAIVTGIKEFIHT